MNCTGDQPAPCPGVVSPTTKRLRLADRLALRQKEAAEALGISDRTLRTWMRDEGLPYARVGGIVIIPRVELEEWIAERVASRRSSDEIAEEILREL